MSDLKKIKDEFLTKLSGKLSLSEIGQIAGRAGRFLNNGSFGITGECKEIIAEEVEMLENHKFEEIQSLFWRNSDLNFNNPYNIKLFFILYP